MLRLLLSHHGPDETHRCVRWLGVFWCRRCAATWPLAAVVCAAGLSRPLPAAGDLELLLLLAPPLGEYLATHLGTIPYRRWRTWLMGAWLGLALGRLLHRYLLDPADPVPWILLASAGLPALAAGIAYSQRSRRR